MGSGLRYATVRAREEVESRDRKPQANVDLSSLGRSRLPCMLHLTWRPWTERTDGRRVDRNRIGLED